MENKTAESVADTRDEDAKLHSSLVDELYKFATANFRKLDHDGNGFLSKTELSDAEKSGQWQGGEAKYVHALAENSNEIAQLHRDDFWFSDNSGISPGDLLQLDMLWAKRDTNVGYAQRIRDFGLSNFGRLDFDQRGSIYGYELVSLNGDGALGSKKSIVDSMNPYDKESFSLLYRNMSYIGHNQSIPNSVWIGKPWQFTTEYAINRQELSDYPSAVFHRSKYGLVNKIQSALE